MIVTLDEAKRHLGSTDNADDARITSLVQAATEYLARIGVALSEPLPQPVKWAGLLLIEQWSRDVRLRSEQIDGVAGTTYNLPTVSNDATRQVIDLLIAPYREVQL